MSETNDQLLAWVLAVSLLVVFALPLGIWIARRIAHTRRRRLERSKRQIAVTAEASTGTGAQCPHKRSKSRAKSGPDGRVTSICRFCGVPMLRRGPGQWEVLAAEPGIPKQS